MNPQQEIEANPPVEVESRNIRTAVTPLLDEALAQASTPDEGIWWDLAYAMMPSGPQQMMLHGMLVLYSKSPILGGDAIPYMVVVDPNDLLDPEGALAAMRTGMEGLRTMRAQALKAKPPLHIPGLSDLGPSAL